MHSGGGALTGTRVRQTGRLPRKQTPWIILAAIFFSCYLTWRPSLTIMFTLSDALFLLGLFILVIQHRIPLEPLRFLTPFWLGGFGMLVIGLLVGSVGCPMPWRWLIVAGQYLFAWVVLPLIVMRRGPEQTTQMLKAFTWGVFAMNLFGAYIWFTYTGSFDDARGLLGLDFLSGGRRLGAFTSDANWNGAVLAMAVPAAFYLRAKKEIGNFLILLWLPVLFLGVILTASFTAFIGCAAAVLTFMAVGGVRPSLRMTLLVAIGGALIAFVYFENGGELPRVFVDRVGNAIDRGDISEAGTFEGRMALIREAWGMVENHMLVGIGADQYREVSVYKAPVHNMYLLLWTEGGLVAMFGWVLMMAVLLAAAIRAYPRDRLATALTLSTTTTFLIATTASPHMYARLWSVPVLIALAVSIEVALDVGPAQRRRSVLRQAEAAL
jgi:O-antigen ligase